MLGCRSAGWQPWVERSSRLRVWGRAVLAGTTPGSMFLHPLAMTVRMAPAPSLLQWGSMRLYTQRMCVDATRGTAPCRAALSVHHRSPLSQTPWKTQCASRVPLAGCPSMECQSIDPMWLWSCAGLGAREGEPGAVPGGAEHCRFCGGATCVAGGL